MKDLSLEFRVLGFEGLGFKGILGEAPRPRTVSSGLGRAKPSL